MIDENEVLSIVKERGPVIPREIVVELGGDTFIVGAVLSQLVDAKKIKLSNTKIGSSPTYYVLGQEGKLQNLYKYLSEKEKKAFDIIKGKKIIRDSVTEPALRVALRNIKDFAKALEVNINSNREIFWKWYLLDKNEAETIIRQILSKEMSVQKKPIENVKTENPKITDEPKQQKIPLTEEELEPQKEEPEKLKPKQQTLTKKSRLQTDVQNLFSEKNIEILETEVIRKNSDIEMIINIPSPVGKLKYFCKIKSKKKTNDKDLSSIYVEAQMKKMPVLYVTSGELTKKAQEKLEAEFKTITVLFI